MAGKNSENVKIPTKNWLTTLLLCWFLGFLGIHRLYAGKIGSGFLLLYWTVVAALVTNLNVYLGLACFVGVGALRCGIRFARQDAPSLDNNTKF